MHQCTKCAKECSSELVFCPRCGTRLRENGNNSVNSKISKYQNQEKKLIFKLSIAVAATTVIALSLAFLFILVLPIRIDYHAAEQARAEQDYQRAAALYSKHPAFRDSEEKAQLCLSFVNTDQPVSTKNENPYPSTTPTPVSGTVTDPKPTAPGSSSTAPTQEPEPTATAPAATTAPTEQPSLLPERILLDQTSIVLEVGSGVQLSSSFYPDGSLAETVNWNTSDPAVITVTDGRVTALSSGCATVSASTESGLSASCEVTVIEYPSALRLTQSSIELNRGQSFALTVEISPETATERDITWSSSDPDIVTVNAGTITALDYGSTIITAKTSNGITATATVNVPNPLRLETIAAETMDEDDYLVVDNQGMVFALFSDYSGYDKKSAVVNLITGETLDLSADLPLTSEEGNPYRSTMLYDAHLAYDRYNGRLYVLGNSDADAKTAMVIYDITDLNDPLPVMCYSSSKAIQNKAPVVANPASENNPKKTYVLSDGSFLVYLNSDRESAIKPSKDTIGRCAYDLVVGDYSIQYRFDSETFIRTDLSTGTEKTVYFSGETPPELTKWEQVFPGMGRFYFWNSSGLCAYDLEGRLETVAEFGDIRDQDHITSYDPLSWKFCAVGCNDTVFVFYDAANRCIRRLSLADG